MASSAIDLRGDWNAALDFETLLKAPEIARFAPAGSGPRARKSRARAHLAGTGAIAALLGLEGCLPVVADPEMTAPARGGANPGGGAASGAAPAAPADGGDVAIAENATSNIPVESLLKGLPGATSLLSVVSAENGTAALAGSVVRFTPAPGFEGPASITFTYRTASGEVGTARSDITVDDASASHDHGAGGGHDGQGGGGGHGGSSGGGHSGTPHADDPAKAAEHMAVLDLVKVADATHIAVKSGSWFDPSTWANGEIPGDGAKVVVPDGVEVLYDAESEASIFTVRVDGALTFATDRDTHLVVDTLVVSPIGALTIGAAENPVAAGVNAVITIADNGPIDVSWDPQLLSRGIVSHGDVSIHGAEKENFIRVAADPMAGATSLTLEAPPEGWRVGDRIVLTGTHLTDSKTFVDDAPRTSDATEDEELVITAINGNTITFDRPLQFNHEGARSDLKAIVANYSRSVRIESEHGEATPVHQRGHVMFMHSDAIDVRYAEFHELGRTDKSTRAFDVADLSTVAPDSNVKGRYALHIHRAGVDDPGDPAQIVGNAVWGSPGWGFVHHDSNAIFAGNAAYDVFGAAFVAETGNEIGRWVDNISIKTLGVHTSVKDVEDIDAFDLGRVGAGFWFQGRLVDAVDNVAAGSPGGFGFVYMTRAGFGDFIPVDPSGVPNGEKLRYADSTLINVPNIGIFTGNEAFATYHGLEIVKAGQQQNHDVRSVIKDFTAWEVDRGVALGYTAHYTLDNLDLVASDRPTNLVSIGVEYYSNVFDAVVVGGAISGFTRGFSIWYDSVDRSLTDFQYYFIDVGLSGNDVDYFDDSRSGLPRAPDHFLTRAELRDGALGYEFAGAQIIDGPDDWAGERRVALDGFKTDSIGRIATSTDYDPFGINYFNIRGAVEQNGYWHLPDGRLVTMIEEYVSDRVTGALEKFALFVEVPSALHLAPDPARDIAAVRVAPVDHGLLDLSNLGPITGADSATVKSGQSVVIDVLANDRDPEGDAISLDAIVSERGHVVANNDGTVTYFADPGFTGTDTFFYWAEDDQGNFTKTPVTVTVEI